MDISDEHTAKAATVSEDQEPSRHHTPKERPHSNSPVAIFYDYEQKTVRVRSKKNAGRYFP